jgi:hypothetical protein
MGIVTIKRIIPEVDTYRTAVTEPLARQMQPTQPLILCSPPCFFPISA